MDCPTLEIPVQCKSKCPRNINDFAVTYCKKCNSKQDITEFTFHLLVFVRSPPNEVMDLQLAFWDVVEHHDVQDLKSVILARLQMCAHVDEYEDHYLGCFRICYQ